MAAHEKYPRPVVVTTQCRGVFYGRLTEPIKDGKAILASARNCVYWPAEVKGFLGLATTGPLEGSRVGPAAETITLYGVTCVAEVSRQAAEAWEAGPWRG